MKNALYISVALSCSLLSLAGCGKEPSNAQIEAGKRGVDPAAMKPPFDPSDLNKGPDYKPPPPAGATPAAP